MQRKWVYRIGVIFIFIAVLFTPASYLIFGKIEKGRVIENAFIYSGISMIPSSTYPKIEFKYQNKNYLILGEENQEFLVGDQVKVIFFKNNPSNAKVFTFAGLFIDTLIQLPVCLLIWWALFKSFPKLFVDEKIPIDILSHRSRKKVIIKEQRISDAHIAARVMIYSLTAFIIISLIYALWIVYKEIESGRVSYQTGIGISMVILIIIVSIIHRVKKG